jgi:hypothetical protein
LFQKSPLPLSFPLSLSFSLSLTLSLSRSSMMGFNGSIGAT